MLTRRRPFQLRNGEGEHCFYHIVNKHPNLLILNCLSFAVRTQNKNFLTLHKQANPLVYGFHWSELNSVRTNAIKACVKISCSMCIFTQCISIQIYDNYRNLRKWPVFAQRVTYITCHNYIPTWMVLYC